VLWPVNVCFLETPHPRRTRVELVAFLTLASSRTLESELPKAFCDPDQQAAVQELAETPGQSSPTEEALLSFRDKLRQIITPPSFLRSRTISSP